METFFFNPNVAYLMLVAGFLLAILALLSPGTGVFEAAALLTLLLAGWEVYHMPINLWALIILLGGVFPFLLALRKSQRLVYLGYSIATLMIGSAFLFKGDGWKPAVNPLLTLVVSTLTSGFLWLVATKTLETAQLELEHDPARLIGAIGETKTEVFQEGSVQVGGELWSARSTQPVPKGKPVRVVSREGLILEVELVL
jgi:membrane-bound serine protease (ClpP class)